MVLFSTGLISFINRSNSPSVQFLLNNKLKLGRLKIKHTDMGNLNWVHRFV